MSLGFRACVYFDIDGVFVPYCVCRVVYVFDLYLLSDPFVCSGKYSVEGCLVIFLTPKPLSTYLIVKQISPKCFPHNSYMLSLSLIGYRKIYILGLPLCFLVPYIICFSLTRIT